MPQDAEPRVRSRQGLLENAGGGLVCPHCRTHEVWPQVVIIRLRTLSIQLHVGLEAATVNSRDDDPKSGMIADFDVDMKCANRHVWGLVVSAEVTGTRIRTEWVEDDEP